MAGRGTRAKRSSPSCALALSIGLGASATAFAQDPAASSATRAPAGGHRIAELPQEALARRATQADADAVLASVNRLLDAYQLGDIPRFDALLANTLPGRQRLLEGLLRGLSSERHARIHLFDVQVTAGPDVAAIQAGWEKRSLSGASFAPQLERGRFNLLARRAADHGGWLLTAIEGDNPFAPGASTAIAARLAIGTSSIALASLSTRCAGTTAPPVSTTALNGSLSGTATFAARSSRASTNLAANLSGARLGSVPVGVADYVVTLNGDPLPGAPISVPISIPLTASATGGAGGPFAVVATAPAFQATITYPDPTPGPSSVDVQGTLSGTVTIDPSNPRLPTATGLLSGTLLGTGVAPVALNLVQVPFAISTSDTNLPRGVQVSIQVRATLTAQENGRYAGIGRSTDTVTITRLPGGTFDSIPVSTVIATLTPGTVPVRAAVLAPRPAINAQVSGPPVDLRLAVAGSNVACAPVALSIEVQSAALQGQAAVTVQVTTDQGDREALNLPEIAPGRFARTTVPLARTGGTRPGNGVVDVVDPGTTLTVTFVDAQPLAGQPPVRPLTGTVRVQ